MNTAACASLLCAISVTSLSAQQNGAQQNGAQQNSTIRLSPGATGAMYTGTVMMADGSPMPGSVDIKVVCNGTERTVAHTTLNDDFEFQWTRAAQPGTFSANAFTNPHAGANADASSVIRAPVVEQYGYCDLRAWLPGYRSSEINLQNPAAFNGAYVGVLWLRPMNTHRGQLVSALTLRAPKDARKLFDQGAASLRSGNFPAAAASFQRAVAVYPEYADAWLNLGRAQFRMGANDAAATSLERAVALDPKIPGAWQTLGYVAFNQRRWNDAAGYLGQAEQLDPLDSPTPWFYSAVALFELKKYDQAKKSIRTEIDMDPEFRNVRARYVLGIILLALHEDTEGSQALRSYLAGSPDPRDVAPVNAVLSRLQPEARN